MPLVSDLPHTKIINRDFIYRATSEVYEIASVSSKFVLEWVFDAITKNRYLIIWCKNHRWKIIVTGRRWENLTSAIPLVQQNEIKIFIKPLVQQIEQRFEAVQRGGYD